MTVHLFRLSCAGTNLLGNVVKARYLGAGIQGNSRVADVTAKSNPCVSDYQLGILHGFTVNAGARVVSHRVGFLGGRWKRVVAAVVRQIEALTKAVVGSTLEPSLAICVVVTVTFTNLQKEVGERVGENGYFDHFM